MIYQVTIEHNGPMTTTHETYEEAIQVAQNEGAQVTEHSGDLTDGGDRTLLWASEVLAEGDDGQRAMGCIEPAEED